MQQRCCRDRTPCSWETDRFGGLTPTPARAVFKALPTVLITELAASVFDFDEIVEAVGMGMVRIGPFPFRCMCFSKNRYNRAVAAGLLMGSAGDALLAFDGMFQIGLGAFLVGRLFYFYAFLEASRPAAPLPLYVGVLWSYVPNKTKLPLAHYTIFLISMTGRTIARVGGSARFFSD